MATPKDGQPIDEYNSYLHQLHRFDIQETWDWYMDWHFAFSVSSLDSIVDRFIRDGIPFVTRSSSFYVEVG